MNEDDLRDCYKMFAMLGYLMNGDYSPHEIPSLATAMADAMIEEGKQKDEVGIASVKRIYRRKAK